MVERCRIHLGVGKVLCSFCWACLYLTIAVSLIYIKNIVVLLTALLTAKRLPAQGASQDLAYLILGQKYGINECMTACLSK